jgi:hypothetical protein
MNTSQGTRPNRWPRLLLIFLLAALAFSLFTNIGHPLLWNDEGETAMFAERILRFGYPKVHDGKNVINHSELPDKSRGLDPSTDAYIWSVWGQYYFAVLGAWPARLTGNLYLKTALLRIPFALAGLLGLVLMLRSVWGLVGPGRRQTIFAAAFFFFELLSVSIVLHLREVRYYSLVLLISGGFLLTYFNFRLRRTLSGRAYFWLTTALLFLLFNTFVPAFICLGATLAAAEFFGFLKHRSGKDLLRGLLPLAAALLAAAPLLYFFKTVSLSRQTAALWPPAYGSHLRVMITFLSLYEFLPLALFAKVLSLALWLGLRPKLRAGADDSPPPSLAGGPSRFFKTTAPAAEIGRRVAASGFLGLLVLVHMAVIPRIPLPQIFARYYILLQPILILIILLDGLTVLDLAGRLKIPAVRQFWRWALIIGSGALFLWQAPIKAEVFREHIYELLHAYRGPLDYAIPYVAGRYPDPEKLVIATNYEESVWMYYLRSRVTVGYAGNNIEEDSRIQPDIIVPRKRSSPTNRLGILQEFLRQGGYRKRVFAVADYTVNNIPEFNNFYTWHQFRTRKTAAEKQALVIYERRLPLD